MKYEEFESFKPVIVYGIKFEGKIVYIGMTTRGVKARATQHFANALFGKGRTYNSSPKLYDFIRLNPDKANYSIQILEQCSVEDSEKRERYFVDFFDTYENGLNTTKGGNWSRGSEHYMFRKRPDEAITASVRARLGKRHSPEHIEKIRSANTGKKQPVNYVSIVCDQNGKTYESQDAAAKDLGITKADISGFIRAKTAAAGGFTFKYADPELESKRKIKVVKPHWTTRPDAEDIKKSMRKPHKKRK